MSSARQNKKKSNNKQTTLDLYFSPNSVPTSPDLKHFSSERKSGSPSKPSVDPHPQKIDEDSDSATHESDYEPISKRQRDSNAHISHLSDSKRIRPDETQEVDSLKLSLWTPDLNKAVDEAVLEELGPIHHQTTQGNPVPLPAFSQRCSLGEDSTKQPFLLPENLRDAEGRKPDDPNYDPSTLFIPPKWFDEQKISAGQRQWWSFKASNFDCLLLFKVGKFYELYEMDAHIAVEALGLKYMKGSQAHCGFPESAYAEMTSALVTKGYKVAVIEQTETPEQLKLRNEELRSANKPLSKVVSREKVAVVTKGTLKDAEMMENISEANYLMAICGDDSAGCISFGICLIDVASSQILLGQFKDNNLFSLLRSHIAQLEPVEFILPAAKTSFTEKIKEAVSGVIPEARLNFTLKTKNADISMFLESYFGGADLPDAVRSMEEWEMNLALESFAVVVEFLREAVLDRAIIPICSFSFIDSPLEDPSRCLPGNPKELQSTEQRVCLDSTAMENLEIFRDSEGKTKQTLLASLDFCSTPFGKRLLKKWIGRPLIDIAAIQERQDAIEDLLTTGASAVGLFRNSMGRVGDLERSLARLNSSQYQFGRDAGHVILYEDATKKKVSSLVSCLRGLQTINDRVQNFGKIADQFKSNLLKFLVTPGMGFPEMSRELDGLIAAANWEEAERTGRIIPTPGMIPDYDSATRGVEDSRSQLDRYQDEIKRELGAKATSDVSFVPCRQHKFAIEVAEKLLSKIPSNFEIVSQRKNFKRFITPRLTDMVQSLQSAEDRRETVINRILHELLSSFLSFREKWVAALDATSQLDVLISLSIAAVSIQGQSCRPNLVPYEDQVAPTFKAVNLRHPNISVSGDFVPNDVSIGGEDANFMVLTGANMGGKSTLLRQICLATIMAQVGAYVPAESLELTPVDKIFVRMGAKDRIVCGQSTFFVELHETATMLNNATRQSLVALDELGRGTATADGEAIAHAVLEHLSSRIGCRGLFATHYHSLARHFGQSEFVSVKHMACQVTSDRDVKFLYKLVDGIAPKSYGMNVARLAGLAESVIEIANRISNEKESVANEQ